MIMMGSRPTAARNRNQAQSSVPTLLSIRSSAAVSQGNTSNNFLESVNTAPSIVAHARSTERGGGGTGSLIAHPTTNARTTATTTTTMRTDDCAPFVCPVKLQENAAKPRNTSPFDPKKYFPLLPPQLPHMKGRVTLALDLDETLVHSTVVPVVRAPNGKRHLMLPNETGADAPMLVEAGGGNASCVALRRLHDRSDLVLTLGEDTDREEMIFVQFRPHVRTFLAFASQHFEVIIFTASRSSYADPVMQALMPTSTRLDEETQPLASSSMRMKVQQAPSPSSPTTSQQQQQELRLYREHCADVGGAKVKDMSLLGRPLEKVVLIDNLASSFLFQPRNGVLIKSWFGESDDNELHILLDLLRELATASDVVHVLDVYNSTVTKQTTPQASGQKKTFSPPAPLHKGPA